MKLTEAEVIRYMIDNSSNDYGLREWRIVVLDEHMPHWMSEPGELGRRYQAHGLSEAFKSALADRGIKDYVSEHLMFHFGGENELDPVRGFLVMMFKAETDERRFRRAFKQWKK